MTTDENGARRLEETTTIECGPGDVDIVPPHEIHSEYAGDSRTVAFIVRSQRTGSFVQKGYENSVDGEPISGPNQIPYRLG